MSKKIAIIEDDEPIAQMYRLKFAASGYDVAVAENGRVGLELIEKMQPDVVLLDLMMPEMNGAEMLKELRQKDWGKDVKVVILTNVAAEEASKDVAGFNVSGYIVKAHTTPHQVVDYVKLIED